MRVALAGHRVERARRPVVVLERLLDRGLAEQLGEADRGAAVGAAHLAAREHQLAVAEVLLREQQDALAHRVARVLDRAAGHPGLSRGRGRPGRADAVSAGTTTTRATPSSVRAICPSMRDEALTHLGGRSMNLYLRFRSDDREPYARGRVVVEALGEPDVLEAEAVADAAAHALAVRDVADAAGQAEQVGRARGASSGNGMARSRSSSSATGRRPLHRLPRRQARALDHRVAQAQLDRVELERGGEPVHLRLVGEAGLHRAEAAHRAAGRVVGVHDVAVDRRVRADCRARPRSRRRSRRRRPSSMRRRRRRARCARGRRRACPRASRRARTACAPDGGGRARRTTPRARTRA